MAQYIDRSVLVAEIERLAQLLPKEEGLSMNLDWARNTLSCLYAFINTIEVKEVDLKKLGEIARHLIAVKENIEDMRLNKEEWFMLEKIGYPERFKTQKELTV